jgi:hypothetical protein
MNGGSWTNSVIGYVTGIAATQSSPHTIPDSTIYSKLSMSYGAVTIPATGALFSPATSGLMTQIAAWESRPYCQQFFDPPNTTAMYPDEIVDSWPLESGEDGGSHIGLMQVPISQPNAWDWIQNTTNGIKCRKPTAISCQAKNTPGNSSFQAKLLISYNRMIAMQKGKSPALPALSPCQLEEMALAEYGPYSSPSLIEQYYIPTCTGTRNGNNCTNGSWQWSINSSGAPPDPHPHYCAVCYVMDVRASHLPDNGSSSCGSSDPPTLNCSGCGGLGAAAACY